MLAWVHAAAAAQVSPFRCIEVIEPIYTQGPPSIRGWVLRCSSEHDVDSCRVSMALCSTVHQSAGCQRSQSSLILMTSGHSGAAGM